MERVYTLVVIFFILSMISERLSDFFKRWFSNRNILITKIGDTETEHPKGSKEEKKRKFDVTKLSLFGGFIIAIAAHADFFDIIAAKEGKATLGWDGFNIKNAFKHPDIESYVLTLLGFIFTGFFISLGSKFWHELLDIVLAIKNVKKDIASQIKTNEIVNVPVQEQEQLLSAAVAENYDKWKNTIKNFQGVTITTKVKDNKESEIPCLQFNVTKKETMHTGDSGSVPSIVYYGGIRIPTDVKETGKIVAAIAGYTGEGVTPRPGGSSISREGKKQTGTLGLKVKRGNKWYGISCYHVLFPDELMKGQHLMTISDTKSLNKARVFSPSPDDTKEHSIPLGSVAFGVLNNYLDVAFYETTEEQTAFGIHKLWTAGAIHKYSSEDKKKLIVQFCGRTSGVVTYGVVRGLASKEITYAMGYDHTIHNLLEIDIKADGGDSGAVIITKSGLCLGMIVAVGNGYAYAIQMDSIKNVYHFSFQ